MTYYLTLSRHENHTVHYSDQAMNFEYNTELSSVNCIISVASFSSGLNMLENISMFVCQKDSAHFIEGE